MKIATAAEMARIDRTTIVERRIPGLLLMEHAGIKIVAVLASRVSELARRHVVIVAGPGNNGGDGFVVARLLSQLGCRVEVVALRAGEEYRGDARTNLDALAHLPVKLSFATAAGELERVWERCAHADVVIDAVLGTGSRGELSPLYTAAVERINSGPGTVLAVDLPTGLDPDTGLAAGPAVQAHCTVTMGLAKPGFFHPPGSTLVGQLTIARIGFPDDLIGDPRLPMELCLAHELAPLVTSRSSTAHKGDHGRVLVVGGSSGMTGAAVMAAKAAVRAGAALVRLLLPRSTWAQVAAALPEVLVFPAPETPGGALGTAALAALREQLEAVDVLLLGPGLGRDASTTGLVRQALGERGPTTILDADALRALDDSARFEGRDVVLTPHASEAAHLLGRTVQAVNADRFTAVRRIAASRQAHVILKGPNSLVAGPVGVPRINPSGNAGLATAGSGDVLAGTLAGLLALREAQRRGGRTPADLDRTVSLAVYLHGLCADLALEAKGTDRLNAVDVLDHLSAALKTLGRVAPGELIASDRIRMV